MNPSGQAPAADRSHCLARQPILTRDEKVFGYELLFRVNHEDKRFSSDAESATTGMIEALNVIGFDSICDGRLAFINCSQQMLMKEYLLLLPPDKVVVEIQETVAADERVLAACRQLKEKNYGLALDNFLPDDPREALVPLADYIKVDIRKMTPAQNTALTSKYAKPGCQVLAQKVETREQFVAAEKEGFTLFQGYFFRQPERMRARHIPAVQASYLRLLQEISAAQVDLNAIEDLIKHDASLCYRMLRYLNSPLLGMSSPVQSVRHAMNILGERELIRWIRMATTLTMGQEKCSDLVLASLVRARFCELVSSKVEHIRSDLFLLGMLSLMDSILEIPMGMVTEGLALDPDTKAELLGAKSGADTQLTPIYKLMVAREAGNWEQVTAQAKKLKLSLPFVNRAFNEAMEWARQMTRPV